MARKRRPTKMKKLEGTNRKDRENKNPPKISSKLPDCPEWLSKKGKDLYKKLAKRLHRMNVVSEEDEDALALLCQEYADYIDCRETLNITGLTHSVIDTNENEQIKKRPEVDIANAKLKNIQSMLVIFGLDPTARENISRIGSGGSNNDPLENLFN